MVPNNYISLDENGVQERMELILEKLDELDDVIDVYHNWKNKQKQLKLEVIYYLE